MRVRLCIIHSETFCAIKQMHLRNKRFIPKISLLNRKNVGNINTTNSTRSLLARNRNTPRRPIKKALIIGINYRNQNFQLRGCVNDANNMKNFIASYCGYAQNNIRLLTDDTAVKPTKQNIESGIKWLLQGAQKGDTLLFHYSGHGTYVLNESRIRDETDNYDEAIIPLDYLQKGIIIDDWLYENLTSKVPKDVKLWSFIDCCNSGTMMDLKYNFKSLAKFKSGDEYIIKGMAYKTDEWTNGYTLSIENVREVNGDIVNFSASKDVELSEDVFINESYQGAFTYCLLQTLERQLVIKRNLAQNTSIVVFPANKLTLKDILKEVNCRLDINEFNIQNCELSLSRVAAFENNSHFNI